MIAGAWHAGGQGPWVFLAGIGTIGYWFVRAAAWALRWIAIP